mgnify:CR=1 FL=1
MSKRKKASIVVISSLCTLSLLLMIMYIQGLIPFGNDKSLASMDAHIQYIDLYAYLKDVILGKNSFSYTFSNMLGGSSLAIFSYYLSSPINLLVIFSFYPSAMHFVNIILLKAATLCGLTVFTCCH